MVLSYHARDNIRVNAIAPGYIVTDMTAGGLESSEMEPVWRQMTPMERPGEVDEIATTALFFLYRCIQLLHWISAGSGRWLFLEVNDG